MHAKLFVELGVEVGSRLELISTDLNSSLAATVAEPWFVFVASGASRLMLELILHPDNAAARILE